MIKKDPSHGAVKNEKVKLEPKEEPSSQSAGSAYDMAQPVDPPSDEMKEEEPLEDTTGRSVTEPPAAAWPPNVCAPPPAIRMMPPTPPSRPVRGMPMPPPLCPRERTQEGASSSSVAKAPHMPPPADLWLATLKSQKEETEIAMPKPPSMRPPTWMLMAKNKQDHDKTISAEVRKPETLPPWKKPRQD